MAAKSKAKARSLIVDVKEGERPSEALARKLNNPYNRHGLTALQFQGLLAKGMPEADRPDMVDFANDLKARAEAIASGKMALASGLLAAQAITLDAIFTDLARRAGLNSHEYLSASERYMRLALKAQANSRATIEALAKLHQPREQTVRHVHVNEGGQAVIADQFHHHTGGQENAKSIEQPLATGTGAAGTSPALSGPDPLGNGVPISGDQGAEKVPNARRQGKRRA